MFSLLKYLKTCKTKAILTPIFVILEVIAEVLIPVFMGKLVDEGIKLNQIDVVYKYSILMIILAIFALIFGVLASRYSAIISNEMGRNIRNAEFESIQNFSFENIDKYSTSSLITRLTMDVSMVQNAVQMNIRIAFRGPALILFSIISAFLVAGKLALVFVLVIPFVAFGLFFIMRSAHKFFVKMFKKIDRLNLIVQEDLMGIRAVKSYVREETELEKFDEAIKDVANNAKKGEKWIMFNNPLMQLAVCITFVLISWLGARQMVYSGFTEGQFTNIITYVMQILMSLMMISHVFMMIVISKASSQRILEVINEKPLITEKENAIEVVNDGSIEFRNVSFKYIDSESKKILDKINLKIESGNFVGIFGGTGTGKTSLIQLISRLYDVSEGEVLVGGINVKEYKLKSLRQGVVTVLQKNILFSGTVRDNMRYGNENATDEEIIDALKKAQAYDFVLKMPKFLDAWIEQGGVNLSGGQRQRLSIARALVVKPKVLILDDSTSAVDTKTDMLIRKAFAEEIKDTTKIVISQRLSSIEEADQIIILDDKGINAIGKHEDLYQNNEIYKGVYDAQKKGRDL